VRPSAHPRGRTRARPCAAAPARAHYAHARARPCAAAPTRARAQARTRTRPRVPARMRLCVPALACLRARGTVPAPAQPRPGNLASLVPRLARGALALAPRPRLGPGDDAGASMPSADAKPSHGEAAAVIAGPRPWRPDPRPRPRQGEGQRELHGATPCSLARRGARAAAARAPFVACHAHAPSIAGRGRQGQIDARACGSPVQRF